MKRQSLAPTKRATRSIWWAPCLATGSKGGSVLVTVLAILAALSIILLSALTFALSRYAVHQRDLSRQGAGWLAQTGINRALAGLKSTSASTSLPVDTFATPNGGTVAYVTHSWGALALITAEGRLGSQVARRTALVGSWHAEAVAPAVTIGDETLPMTVTGRTTIVGDVVTGPAGVIEGRLNGIGAVFPNFLRGTNLTERTISLPAIDTTMLRRFLAEVARDQRQRDIVWPGSRLMQKEDHLPLEPGVIYVENNLILDGAADWPLCQVRTIIVGGSAEITGDTHLRSPVRIIAGTHIRVTGQAVLDGILLYAEDSIIFTDSCSFSGTALTPRLVATRRSATLHFPALLVACNEGTHRDTSIIALCSVRPAEATVCAVRLDTAASYRHTVVYIDTAAAMYGCVLTNGITELRGTVYGSVLTEQFVHEVPPTTYVNWLCDCRIDRSRLSYQPALPMLLGDTTNVRAPRILWEGGDG